MVHRKLFNCNGFISTILLVLTLNHISNSSASINLLSTVTPLRLEDLNEPCTLRNSNFLICNDSNSFFNWLQETQGKKAKYVETLTIEDWNNDTLKTSILVKFINLKEFVLEGGILTRIIGDFPPLRKLEKIVLSNNRINSVHSSLFKNLPELVSIDLQKNGLDTIAFPFRHGHKLQSIFLLGNAWDCTKTMKWLLQEEHASLIEDLQQLKCHDKKYIGRPICTVMEFKKFVKEHCRSSELKNCSCTIYYIRKDGIFYAPFYAVNCSSRGFYNLPESLPVNTSVLYMSHNKIRDLSPLVENEVYYTVNDIYLDYNRIRSIDVLWDSTFLSNFRLFNLIGNRITKISPFKIHKALIMNPVAQNFYLSQNPWNCECGFAAHFQQLINTHEEIIRDSVNITCGQNEDDELYGLPIKYLTLKDLCIPEPNTMYWVDILNISMAIVIVLILAKLSYDYFHYRKYGRVPWIVTKMP